jgi:outer membrane lipoprotein-sorting protein
MFKRIASVFAVLAFVSTTAWAASATAVQGKVASIDGKKVEVTVTGEKADWVKKGAGVKFKGATGRIVEVTATGLVFTSQKASVLTVGEDVTLEKGPAVMAGC